MKIPDLFASGVRKVRLPVWNEFAHIELREVAGFLSPVGYLNDIGCDKHPVILWTLDEETWEPWAPPEGYDPRIHDLATVEP